MPSIDGGKREGSPAASVLGSAAVVASTATEASVARDPHECWDYLRDVQGLPDRRPIDSRSPFAPQPLAGLWPFPTRSQQLPVPVDKQSRPANSLTCSLNRGEVFGSNRTLLVSAVFTLIRRNAAKPRTGSGMVNENLRFLDQTDCEVWTAETHAMWWTGRVRPGASSARRESGKNNAPEAAPLDEPARRAKEDALAEIKAAEPRLGWQIWVATLAINLLSLAVPLTILQAYDRILPHKAMGTFTLLVAGASIAILLETGMRMARVAALGQLTVTFESRVVAGTVGRLLATSSSFVSQSSAGELLDKIQSIEILRSYHTGQSRLALIDLPFACLFVWLMFLIGGSIALVPIVMAAGLAPLALRRSRAEEAITVRRRKGEDRRTDLLIEILRGIRTIKFLAAEPLIMRRYDRLQRTTVENSYSNLVIASANQSLNTLFANLVLVSVVTYGAMLVIGGALSVGALAACTMLAGRAVQPILRLYAVHGQKGVIDTARSRLADVLALPQGGRVDSSAFIEVKGAISAADLAFCLLRTLRPRRQLSQFDRPSWLNLRHRRPRSRRQINVSHGLIAGEVKPTAGRICIDGHDLNGEHTAPSSGVISLWSGRSEPCLRGRFSTISRSSAQAELRSKTASKLRG